MSATDLHCHISLIPFNKKKSMWYHAPAAEGQAKDTLPNYTQSDLESMVKGNVKFVVNSLTSIEKGFFDPSYLGTGVVSDYAINGMINFPYGRINEVQSNDFSYFSDLEKEYQLIAKEERQENIVNGKKCSYQIIDSYESIKKIFGINDAYDLLKQTNEIGLILSIEGGHCLGIGEKYKGFPIELMNDLSQPKTKAIYEDVIKNLMKIKNWGGGKHCPLYITFCHHFWNGLAGHSMSFNKLLPVLFDQSEGLNAGFTEIGKMIINEIVSDKNGRSIFIDIKHMSLVSRKWYYDFIEKINNNSNAKKIPIIASHMGMSGVPTMRQMEELGQEPTVGSEKYEQSAIFNNWNINLADEEIIKIYESGGIIGLIFDERVLMGNALLKSINKQIANNRDENIVWADGLLVNLLHIIRVLESYGVSKNDSWKYVCIGSDFDGMINPLDAFNSYLQFNLLRPALIKRLTKKKQGFLANRSKKNIEELVDGFLIKNLLRFLERNW